MIHLQPTSISLSERDIDFHLRQAEIYHGLVRQGFKKDDIVRYLTDYRKATAEIAGQDLVSTADLSIPSTLELAARRCRGSSQDGPEDHAGEGPESDNTSTSGFSEWKTPLPEDVTQDLPGLLGDGERPDMGQEEDVHDQDPGSPISMAPTMHVNKHAPRKSSLLRFAKAASPDNSAASLIDDEKEEDSISPIATVSTRVRGYRRRSNTYPYQSSDPDSGATIVAQDGLIDGMSRMSLLTSLHGSSPVAPGSDDLPFALPPPFSSTPRVLSCQDDTYASPAATQTLEDSYDGSASTRLRPTLSTRRSSSLLNQELSISDVPSSPPIPFTPSRGERDQLQDSQGSPQFPITPTPIRNAESLSRTDPRQHTRVYLDGNSFSVYNDSLPANSQPQTPADLSRRPLITEYEAAYTAPPGMIRQGSASFPYHPRIGISREFGEQSPTARAISLRERRNRELLRSVRAEGIRLQRLQLRDEMVLTQRALDATQDLEHPRTDLLQHMSEGLWRDDLDADRVGEENFENETEINQRRVMRVVSGNARFEN